MGAILFRPELVHMLRCGHLDTHLQKEKKTFKQILMWKSLSKRRDTWKNYSRNLRYVTIVWMKYTNESSEHFVLGQLPMVRQPH